MRKFLWRWHPEVALRYLPIIRKIERLGLIKGSILEVGSGSLGITPYLGREIVGIDIDFAGPQTDLVIKVVGDATKLPFTSRSFSAVLMVDILEHLEKNKRLLAIKEAIRVSKNLLVIAVPCGNKAHEEDLYLSDYYRKVYGKKFSFYEEHLKYGLPTVDWLNTKIKKIAKEYNRDVLIEVEGNVNLSLHRFLMKGWMTKNFIIDLIFRKFFLIFIPLMLTMNHEPTYRKIFYIRFIK